MTRTEVAALVLRLMALYLVVVAVIQASDVALLAAGSIVDEESRLYFLGYLRSTLVRALLGIVLFVAAPRIARSMSGGGEPMRLEDPSAVGVIALRVTAFVLWDAALAIVPDMMSTTAWKPESVFTAALGWAIGVAALGVLLFVAAPSIGKTLFGSRTGSPATTRTAALAAIAFAAIGLWIVAGALPELAIAVADGVRFADLDFRHTWAGVVTAGFRVALGVFLFVGAGAFGRLWHRLSTAGLQQRNDAA